VGAATAEVAATHKASAPRKREEPAFIFAGSQVISFSRLLCEEARRFVS